MSNNWWYLVMNDNGVMVDVLWTNPEDAAEDAMDLFGEPDAEGWKYVALTDEQVDTMGLPRSGPALAVE